MRRFSHEWWTGVYERHPRAQFVTAITMACFGAYALVHAVVDWDGFHST